MIAIEKHRHALSERQPFILRWDAVPAAFTKACCVLGNPRLKVDARSHPRLRAFLLVGRGLPGKQRETHHNRADGSHSAESYCNRYSFCGRCAHSQMKIPE
ncbi:hypothetical protein [Streptomyces sp. NPDC086023]|uniref:hypothetical protein n=1 Tax=Streptomyces sp. NPDC086023 TaxID=3365746 RepID=UPI0037CEA7F1